MDKSKRITKNNQNNNEVHILIYVIMFDKYSNTGPLSSYKTIISGLLEFFSLSNNSLFVPEE